MTDLTNILLVDDNPDDVELALAAFRRTKLANKVKVVSDGIDAMQYLRQQGISKPVDLSQLVKIAKIIEDFWFGIVRLPSTK